MKLIRSLLNEGAKPVNPVKASVKNIKEKMKRVMAKDVYITEYSADSFNSRKASIYFNPGEQMFKVTLAAEPKNQKLPMDTPWKKTKFETTDLDEVVAKITEFFK